MPDKAEQLLSQDASDVNQKVEALPEAVLIRSARDGMRRGMAREKRRLLSFGLSAVVAAAAAIVIFLSNLPTSEQNTSYHAEQPAIMNQQQLDAYLPALELMPILPAPLEHSLIQPIWQSMDADGLRVEVTGGFSDGRKVFILYSVQNNSDVELITSYTSLDLGIGNKVSTTGVLLQHANSMFIAPGEKNHFVYAANLDSSIDYTSEASFKLLFIGTSDLAMYSSSTKYRKAVDIQFSLDPQQLSDQVHTLHTDRTIKVHDQEIHIRQVQYTPLNTYVDIEYDVNNSQHVFSWLAPELKLTNGDRTADLSYRASTPTENSRATLIFENTPYDPNASLILKTTGINALDKDDMELVLDLKQQVMKAPDTSLTFSPTDHNAEPGTIVLQQTNQHDPSLGNFKPMILADSYTDAAGNTHQQSIKYTSGSTNLSEYAYDLGVDALNYPQPLTLTIEQYWNPITDEQTVELN